MKPQVSNRSKLRTVSLGVLLGCLSQACGFEPQAGTIHYSLSDSTHARLRRAYEDGEVANPGAVAVQIQGALEMLFGSAAEPGYMLLDDWIGEIDRSAGGYDELDDAAFDAIKVGNARRFKMQLQLVEARRYAEVYRPFYAQDLWLEWTEDHLPGLLENPDAPYDESDPDYGTRHEEAIALFISHYPTLRESSDMYRQHCLHCHGNEGGGNGPTADFVSPRPRDYRLGKFKWTAVDRNQPRREDLLNILEQGAKGSAMPSFMRFSRGQLEGLVDYVRLLAIRGEVETLLVGDAIDGEGDLPASSVLVNYEFVWEKWDAAPGKYVAVEGDVPRAHEVTPEMLEHGRELFLGTVANCFSCHGPDGRGAGVSLFELKEIDPDADGAIVLTEDDLVAGWMFKDFVKTDDAGNPVLVDGHTVTEEKVARHKLDDWGIARETAGILDAKGFGSNPRNFQQSIFRGGSRPLDFYRRIKYGIYGTVMPAAAPELTDDDIWSLVYFVLSIAEEHDVAREYEKKLARFDSETEHEEH
ncbi:MAG: hypothetical protein E2O39_09390 [Planctomycetota bacterium]|nr:MAG: hypothetical protein E2O39_09390 [Planctomycetota bacterium]